MQKRIYALIGILTAVTFSLCGCSQEKEKTVLDLIWESPAARMELPDGSAVIVDSEIAALRSFADLKIQTSPIESSDSEADWLYRIVFNPTEKVQGSDEITVSFHKDYVQINSEYWLPEEGVPYESVLEWAEGKFKYFFESAFPEEGRYALDDAEVPYLLVQNGKLAVIGEMAVSYMPSGNMTCKGNEIRMDTEYADQECIWTFVKEDDGSLIFKAEQSQLPEQWESWEDGMRFVSVKE